MLACSPSLSGRCEGVTQQGPEERRRLAETQTRSSVAQPLCLIVEDLLYICLASLQINRGELSRAIGLLEHGLALSRERNSTILSEVSKGRLGYDYALSGRIAEGIPLLERALSVSEAMRYGVIQPQFLVDLGEAYVLADRLEDALECARRALTFARERGQRGHETRALRLLGEVTARHDSPDHAESHYREALALAEELGMRAFVAHCHLGLGKLYRRTGARAGAGARRDGDDDVPRHGHDVLDGAGRGGRTTRDRR
jgi:tetratricopeptide (TPR) repeat protein